MNALTKILLSLMAGILFSGTLTVSAWPTWAQGKPSVDLENDPGYQETQKFIANTENMITKVRAETDARAREIEALASQVGDLISNISVTSEDANNLRSELSVVTDLLATERKTTDGLRKDVGGLTEQLKIYKVKLKQNEDRLGSTIATLREENTRALKRLNSAVQTIASQARRNEDLEADLARANKSLERLQKELALVKIRQRSTR